MSFYDVIIVGGGLAGLHTGISLLKKYKGISVAILEKYDYMGGRVVTFSKDVDGVGPVQWEIGAGRISVKHNRVLRLLKQYDLTFRPISAETLFYSRCSGSSELKENSFSDLVPVFLEPLKRLPAAEPRGNTLGELMQKIYGDGADTFIKQFPYDAEIHTLRADLALESFSNEMRSNEGFGVCVEGLSSLVDGMVRDFQRLGGVIVKNMSVVRIAKEGDGVLIDCKVQEKACKTILRNRRRFSCGACVLALHSSAVKGIDGVRDLAVLRHLEMRPLMRIYAVFPPGSFKGIPKIVTDSPIRYVIPVDLERGVVMISYTDGGDVEKLLAVKDRRGFIMKELRKIFPDVVDPLFYKEHPWTDGCTYWLPGNYDVSRESEASLQIDERVFMCGESFAVRQCWMESALEQAEKLLGHAEFCRVIKQISK
jgi:hypothetical protein